MNNENVEEVLWWKNCTVCDPRFRDSMKKLFNCFPTSVRDFKTDKGMCPECKQKEREQREKENHASWLFWNRETIKKYFTDNPPYKNQELIIRDTSGCYEITYALVTVIVPERGRQKRIVVEGYSNGYSGLSFYRSGQNCHAPRGQVQLLPYHEIIGQRIKDSGGNTIQLSSQGIVDLLGEYYPS